MIHKISDSKNYVDLGLVRDPNLHLPPGKGVDPTQKKLAGKSFFSIGNTVDGRNPAPVDMENLPCLIGFCII